MEELDQKQFTRERIKNRMLRRAAELWGYPESQIDEFDPLVRLLIEACAVEFERTAGEIGKTQNRMLERLARLLYPGQTDVRPAAAIMQARPAEASEMLYPEDQFFFRDDNQAGTGQTGDIFFTPARAVRIFDAAIVLQVTVREAFRIEEEQKTTIAVNSKKSPAHHNVLWLGVEAGEDIRSFDGLMFFFQWHQMPENENWLTSLPYTEWRIGGQAVTPGAGMPALPDADKSDQLGAAFNAVQQLESGVCKAYERSFLHIPAGKSPEMTLIRKHRYPEEFETLFSKKELQEMKDPLLWIEIRFPTVIPREALDKLSVFMNVFPVINRKLNRVHYKLGQRLNILPLETTANFLAIKEISNSRGETVKLVPFANAADLLPETYTLRYGINRFDERNTQEVLTDLTDLIREESSYFSSLGEDFLGQHIRELNQVLARIESRLGTREKQASPFPYLVIRPLQEGGNVHVEFWSCDGAAANRIAAGARLTSYQNSSVISDSLRLIIASSAGKDKFTDAEKIDEYKKMLLTHDRVVTREDLRRFVLAELDGNARDLQFRLSYMKSDAPGEGFVRCMEIIIDPSPGYLNEAEWKQFIFVLRSKLEQVSTGQIPYRITVTGHGKI